MFRKHVEHNATWLCAAALPRAGHVRLSALPGTPALGDKPPLHVGDARTVLTVLLGQFRRGERDAVPLDDPPIRELPGRRRIHVGHAPTTRPNSSKRIGVDISAPLREGEAMRDALGPREIVLHAPVQDVGHRERL